MSRYIDADLLKKNHLMADDCNDCEQYPRSCHFDYNYTKRDFCEWIDDEPTADVREVVRGEWIEVDDALVRGYCSQCGWEAYYYEDDVVGMPYCPNCGADMRGDEDEQIH